MTKLANGQTIEIRGGRVIDPASQFDESASVFIADGKIAGIGQTPAGFKADQVIDAQGLVVAPGLVDLSARIAGNIDAELAAAVAGGVTTLACPAIRCIMRCAGVVAACGVPSE